MSWINLLGGRLPDFEDVVRRFPVPVAIMAAFTIWIVTNNHSNLTPYKQEEYIASGFILAGYIAVIAALGVEARKGPPRLCAAIGLALAIPAFLFSYFSQKLDFSAVMAIGGAILFLGNAAAWRMAREDRNVWNFTQKLWTGALFAAVGSVIFLIGMFAISEAVRALFGVNLNILTIETILPVGLAFLAPIYWLGTLPRYGEAADVEELSFEARALSFLGTWMLAPLVIIYALIVLAYGVKILVQWDLPKGEIAQLVSPFIGVGMLVWLMLEPKVLKESGFVRFYRAAWHWVMLPAAVLLGVAVFFRIGEYGFTVERFFLALVVIWAAVQSLWFTVLPKVKRDIRFPTALAAGLLLFGSFAAGPISLKNQFQRAKSAKAEIASFEPDVVRKNPEVAKRFLGGLKYIIQRQDEARFKNLVPDYEMPWQAYGDEYEALMTSLGLNQLVNGKFLNRRKFDLPDVSDIDVSVASRLFFNDLFYLNTSTRVDGKSDFLSKARGFTLTYNLGDDVIVVDLEAIVNNQSKFEIIEKGMPLSLTTQNGKIIQLYLLGRELSFVDEELTRAVVAPLFVVPN